MDQEQISSFPAEENVTDGDKKTENSYGKFNSAEELLKAYTALESEFTKRSQRLKELETAAKTAQKKEAVKTLFEKYPVAEQFEKEVNEELAKSAGAENGYQEALLTVLTRKVKSEDEMARDERVIRKVLSDEENREYVINGYLERIRQNSGVKSLPKGGAIPVAPVYRPRSVKEAGEIAKKILERM